MPEYEEVSGFLGTEVVQELRRRMFENAIAMQEKPYYPLFEKKALPLPEEEEADALRAAKRDEAARHRPKDNRPPYKARRGHCTNRTPSRKKRK